MSNILAKAVKNVKILSVIVAFVLAAAIAVGIVCGVSGFGVFNKDALLKDSKTLTVSVNQYMYQTRLDEVEDECEAVLGEYGISYEMKGTMSGDDSEIVYVFANDADLEKAKTALEAKFDDLMATKEWEGTSIIVATNSEAALSVLAKDYILRGIIAGVVLSALVFAYVAIRHGLYMGIVATVSTALGTLLTTALFILTRIPVTASVIYVIAASALLTAVMTLITLNKIREKAQNAEGLSAEEVVTSALATKEIVLLTAVTGVALVIMGAVATAGVRWFAILSLVALLVAACIGLVYVPALYLPFKVAEDAKPVEGAYVGAAKTSMKVKKVFEKKKEVKAIPVKEVVEEAPVEEVTEEEAEESVEAEETTEEVVEETVEEVTEEAPVEETEEKQE